jgi:hypothetical protein
MNDESPAFQRSGVAIEQNFSNDHKIRAKLAYPEMSAMAVNEFQMKNFIPAAFPTLFPTGRFCLTHVRKEKVSEIEYFKYLMLYEDGRFARHPVFRFFCFSIFQRHQALTKGRLFVQKNSLSTKTCSDLRGLIERNPNYVKRVMFYASKIAGNNSYWYKRSSELIDMVKQLGMPSLFITLSAADLQDPDLSRILKQADTSSQSQSTLLNRNPLIANWFFEKKVSFLSSYPKSHKDLTLSFMHLPYPFSHTPKQFTQRPYPFSHIPKQVVHIPYLFFNALCIGTHRPYPFSHAPKQFTHRPYRFSHATKPVS